MRRKNKGVLLDLIEDFLFFFLFVVLLGGGVMLSLVGR
jgi:hypothetical protein